jgi:voltage-gated potassium channel
MQKKFRKEESIEDGWRQRLHEIIFEADTASGRVFDVVLLWAILLSVAAVMLESVPHIAAKYGTVLAVLEWGFTVIFTIEYVARIISVKKPLNYIFSFFGLIDLLSLLPTYLGIFYTDTASLRVIRILRLMRVFRVLKLIGFMRQAQVLQLALRNSRQKIIVFMMAVLILVVILGTVMYIIEDHKSGFSSIPRSIYWAIVTLTTVGYGDITPVTAVGQALASVVMIIGYAIIAVPTGIVTAELSATKKVQSNTKACFSCNESHHEDDASFCKKCGEPL